MTAIGCYTSGIAQETARWTPIVPKPQLSFAINSVSPSNSLKDDAQMVNSTSVGIDYSIPFASFRKGWDGTVKGRTYLSLNIGGTYNFGGSGNPSTPLPSGYVVSGATSSNVSPKGTDPAQAGFRMGAGPQANIQLGNHFVISPMLLGEYFSITQKELSVVQTIQYNGQSYDFVLNKMPETKTSGFAITPKLRLQYKISESFGLFAEGSYTTGPKVETQFTNLVPNGNGQSPNNTYNIQQLETATYVKGETKSTAYSAMSFGGGISISFGGRKGWNGKQETSKSEYKGWNGKTETAEAIRKGWDGTVKGLFDIKSETISVTKIGGVEKLIDNINNGGKAKAEKTTIKGKEFISVTSKNKDITTYTNFPIDNSNPNFKVVNPSNCTGNCMSCTNIGLRGCNCDETSTNPTDFCNNIGATAVPITSYTVSALNASAIGIEADDNGTTVTSTSIKDFHNYISSVLPKSVVGKSEIITVKNEKYLVTAVKWNGEDNAIYSKLVSARSSRFTVKENVMMSCVGTCPDNGSQCTGFTDYSGDRKYKCRCSAKCGMRIIRLPEGPSDPIYSGPISTDNNWKN